MTTQRPHLVILGGGVAGYSAADTIRGAGFEGAVTLVSAEADLPYDRTYLSKAYLQGKKADPDVLFKPAEHYRNLGIDLHFGDPVTAVDLDQKRLTFASGEQLSFDQLLIATGAEPIRLSGPGFDLPNVLYLRSLADARALRERLERAERVLVIGAGFIGCEIAASARILEKSVVVVDPAPVPLSRAFSEEVGNAVVNIHRQHGVEWRLGRKVAELRGHGQAEEAVLDDGSRVACDLVVVGVGVRPADELFANTALKRDNGILVDEYCQTNVPGVYAVGDVANWWSPAVQHRFRLEHFDHAVHHGAAAAKVIAGDRQPYDPVPYFWSDHYDLTFEYTGYPLPWNQVVIRGDLQQPAFTAFYLKDGVIQSAVVIRRPRELRAIQRLIRAKAQLDPAQLADPSVDLRELAKAYQQSE